MSTLEFLNDSLLSETLTEEEYLQERLDRCESSAGTVRSVLSNVRLFCLDQGNHDFTMISTELKRDYDSTGKFSKSLNFFQKFVNWMNQEHPELKLPSNHFGHFEPFKKKSSVTIKNYLGQLRLYFKKVVGIEISSEKLADYITYPAIGEIEDAAPLTHDEFKSIINSVTNKKRRLLYLIQKDTCSRIGAMVQLRLENFNTTVRPIQVTFPAHIMKKDKNGESKTVIKYVTTENEFDLIKLLDTYHNPRDIIFGTNVIPKKAVHNEEKFWSKRVKKLGFTEVYRHSGRLKKNIHSIKAFTETQAEEAVDKFYADAYGDHASYLKQYIRWSDQKKIEKFRLLEPLLNLYTIIVKTRDKKLLEDNRNLTIKTEILTDELLNLNDKIDDLQHQLNSKK